MSDGTDPGWEMPLKQIWCPMTVADGGAVLQNYAYKACATCDAVGEGGAMNFQVPSDFLTLVSAVAIIIPTCTDGTAGISIASYYGAQGEAYNTHIESDEATTYDITDTIQFEIDVSGILTGIAIGDYVGVFVRQRTAGDNYRVFGIKLIYA